MNKQDPKYWIYFWWNNKWFFSGANPVGAFNDINKAYAKLSWIMSIDYNQEYTYVVSDTHPCTSPPP